jgi:hypothetical protein
MGVSTLDSLLGALSVEIEAFAICEIADNVRLIFPPNGAIEVRHVLSGQLYLTVDGQEPIEIGAGGVLIVPPGRLQHLSAAPYSVKSKMPVDVCLPVRDGMVVLDATDGGTSVLRVACGTVLADPHGSYGPLDGLSQTIAENLSDVPVVAAAFGAMLTEAAEPSEGTMALTSALMKACLVVLLRRHLQASRSKGTPRAHRPCFFATLASDARLPPCLTVPRPPIR